MHTLPSEQTRENREKQNQDEIIIIWFPEWFSFSSLLESLSPLLTCGIDKTPD
jgi:hypothetical protein